MLLFHTKSSIKYGKPGLYWVNHFTTICEEHFFQECSLFFFEKQEAVSLSQAGVPRYTLTIQFRDYIGATVYLFNSSGTPLYGPNNYYSMGSGYKNASITWNNTNGLTVCKPGSKTETVKAKAGDTITVRIQQSGSNSFDPMHFSTFTLEAKDQTITP